MPELSVIIPCLNEAGAAARFGAGLLPELGRITPAYEVLAVDGGSSDGTPAVLERLSAREPRVRLIRLPAGGGLGGALRAGIAAAAGRLTATIEADFSFHPSQLAALVSALESEGAACAAGSPFLGSFEGIRPCRRLLTSSANLLLRLAFSRRLTAYTQMFRVFETEKLRALTLRENGYPVNAEIIAGFLKNGWKITEVPVVMRKRDQGRSKMNAARETAGYLRLILRSIL